MSPMPPTHHLALTDPRAKLPELTGGKASSLARLVQAGHLVPAGVVLPAPAIAAWLLDLPGPVTPELVRSEPLNAGLLQAIAAALAELGGPVAVRSSGLAEDLAHASFAGLYETVLGVSGVEAVERAVRVVVASGWEPRVTAYREERGLAAAPMAVLLQRMVPADAAGVAFTADPVTGDRDVVVLSAVSGLGEALVSGSSDAEAWEIRGQEAVRRRSRVPVLDPATAAAVAELARRVAGATPTDIEWAVVGSEVFLLQARPMTAVPDVVSWEPGVPGGFLRNFRLGEWLGAPMTPLTDTWLVTDLEQRTHAHFESLFGVTGSGPIHVTLNGWYFYGAFNYDTSLWATLAMLPRALWSFLTRFSMAAAAIPPLAHLGFDGEVRRWRTELLPAWRDTTARLEAIADTGSPQELCAGLQAAIDGCGDQMASVVGVAGYAAKAEGKLFEFWKQHLAGLDGSVHDVVVGAPSEPAPHDVEGLDWVFPTLGERGPLPPGPSAETRDRLAERRQSVLAAARAALPPRRAKQLDALVGEANRAHMIRQEQTGLFTLAWPAMRRALRRLGAHLVDRRVLHDPADVVFLTRAELDTALAGATDRPPVADRRALWERQRHLTPPLVVGERTGLLKDVLELVGGLVHHEEHNAPDALPGMPGSPGRVTGPARVVRSVDELDRLLPGEILVCPVTTPAWTLAFGRALAIVTDTGSVASHASIVAREHGIPAVVATGDGTRRIVDGQRVTVDGGRGVVRLGG